MNEVLENQPHMEYLRYPAISQSMLTELARSPKHLKHYIQHSEEQSYAMKMGTLVHSLVLTPEQVANDFLFIPEDVDKRSKLGKSHIESLESEALSTNKMLIKEADYRHAMSIAESVLSEPAVIPYIKDARRELSLYKTDEATGVQLKARVDLVPKGGNMLADIKTSDDAGKWPFLRSVRYYKYYLQAAFYLDMYSVLVEPKESFAFIVVEKSPPYAVGVYYLNEATIAEGRREYRILLDKYKQCMDTNVWHGYTEKPEEIGIL